MNNERNVLCVIVADTTVSYSEKVVNTVCDFVYFTFIVKHHSWYGLRGMCQAWEFMVLLC